jgi:hypothetical protein
MRNYPLKLDGYGLTQEEYQELYWFCRQYPSKKQALSYMLNPSQHIGIEEYKDNHGRLCGTAMPHGNKTSDPVFTIVSRREALLRDCEMIEQAAIAADSGLYQAIMRNVTLRESFARIDPPCGKNQFTEIRRKFFYILWLKRQNEGFGGNTQGL